jgi:hypothetical protein
MNTFRTLSCVVVRNNVALARLTRSELATCIDRLAIRNVAKNTKTRGLLTEVRERDAVASSVVGIRVRGHHRCYFWLLLKLREVHSVVRAAEQTYACSRKTGSMTSYRWRGWKKI